MKLPESVQTKLFAFMDSIPKTPFFKPDGKPKKEWTIFYDDTWASAWDFALAADFIIVSDLDFKDKAKHQAHVDARIEVWRKGYGLLCDVDGVLYVYAVKPKTPPTKEQRQLEAKKLRLKSQHREAAKAV